MDREGEDGQEGERRAGRRLQRESERATQNMEERRALETWTEVCKASIPLCISVSHGSTFERESERVRERKSGMRQSSDGCSGSQLPWATGDGRSPDRLFYSLFTKIGSDLN